MSDTRIDDDYDTEADANPMERGKWVSALIALAGAWLLAEAVLFDLLPSNFWNDVIVGVLLLALGGYNYYLRSNDEIGSTAVAAVAALLGLWLIASPWVYGVGAADFTTVSGFWNDVLVGLVVFVLGVYSVYEARDTDVATITT